VTGYIYALVLLFFNILIIRTFFLRVFLASNNIRKVIVTQLQLGSGTSVTLGRLLFINTFELSRAPFLL
jgi:hypothetical protein